MPHSTSSSKTREKSKKKRKNQDTCFGYHVVCYIDVLGQKQKLARWTKLPENGQITPDFVDAIQQTAGTVLGFRDQFKIHFKQLGKCTIPDKLAGTVSTVQGLHYQGGAVLGFVLVQFADFQHLR